MWAYGNYVVPLLVGLLILLLLVFWKKIEPLLREGWRTAQTFLEEVRSETKKVTWPARRDILGSTLVVVVAVFIIAGFLGIVDFGLSLVVGALIK